MSDKISPKVYAAIIATGLMSFCGVIVETSMNITFPTLMREYNLATNTVQWMTSIYLLVVSIVVPLSAILKSSFKIRHLFLTANLLFLLGLAIDAVAPAFPFLLLGRAIQGVGTGIALPLMFNIILEQVPQSKVGTMMGIGNMITGIAPAIGPTFGGLIVSKVGWRWIFCLLIPLIIISLLLGLWGIQQKAPVIKQHLDMVSFLAIAFLFTGFIYGFSNLSGNAFFSLKVGGSILIGVVALAVLIWRSAQLKIPILNLSLLKHHVFGSHVLALFLIQMMSLGNAFLLPNYIQLVNHNTALLAGILVLPAGVVGAIMSPVGGKLLDRHGARLPIVMGSSIMVVVLALFALLSRQLNNGLIVVIYSFYMGAMGMTMASTMTNALNSLTDQENAQGNAIINTCQQFAGAMGTSIVSAIVALSQHAAGSKADWPTAIGTQHAYVLLTVFSLVIWVALFMNTKKKGDL